MVRLRRRRLFGRARSFFGPRRPPRFRNRQPLEEAEEAFILADIHELGGRASARALRLHKPGRYHPAYLTTALRRMRKKGRIKGGFYDRGGSRVYVLNNWLLDKRLSEKGK